MSNFLNNIDIETLNKEKYQSEARLNELNRILENKKKEIINTRESMPDYLKQICDTLMNDNLTEEQLQQSLAILEQKQIELEKIAGECINNLQASGIL